MHDISDLINQYNKAANEAKAKLERKFGVPVKSIDIQELLGKKLELPYSVDVIRHNLTCDKILELLGEEDFRDYYYVVIDTVELDESALPEELPKLLTEKIVSVKNEIWEVHKTDADPFPSDPHAHNYEANVKLHLGNGYLYRKREIVGKIKRKELLSIRTKIECRDISLPPLEV